MSLQECWDPDEPVFRRRSENKIKKTSFKATARWLHFDAKFTPAQWLQKVNSHRTAARWTDEETITQVFNSFRGQEVLEWYDSLKPLGIDTAVWVNIQNVNEMYNCKHVKNGAL